MTRRSSRNATQLMTRSAELAFVAPQVIAHRLSRMALAGPAPSARDRREFHRMVAEKPFAFGQAWTAMAIEAARAQQAVALSLWRSFWVPAPFRPMTSRRAAGQLNRALLGIAGKGLAPVHRAATTNARRLARTRLR